MRNDRYESLDGIKGFALIGIIGITCRNARCPAVLCGWFLTVSLCWP